jgi:hypothetical protein
MWSYTSITQVNATTDRLNGLVPVGDSSWSQALDPPHPAGSWLFPAENVAMGINLSANWSGTLHLEGVDVDSIGVNEGMQINGGASGRLQMAYCRLGAYDPVIAFYPNATSQAGSPEQGIRGHGDALQAYSNGGPGGGIYADRCTFLSAYQGWILQGVGTPVGHCEVRNCNWRMMGSSPASPVLDQNNTTPTKFNNWLSIAAGRNQGSAAWQPWNLGVPPGGDFCPADVITLDHVGAGYN